MKSYDLLGQKFGKLTVVEQTTKNGKKLGSVYAIAADIVLLMQQILLKEKQLLVAVGEKKI